MFLTLLISFFGQLTYAKLLQINEWHYFKLNPGQKAYMDLNVFQTCDRLNLVISSPSHDTSIFSFLFDGDYLEKIDVSSISSINITKPPLAVGGCREYNRRPILINITSSYSFYELHIDNQIYRRPKERFSDSLGILIPQDVPCCLIRSILLTDNDVFTTTPVNPRLSGKNKAMNAVGLPIETTTLKSITATTSHPLITVAGGAENAASPTRASQLISWTELVNREWSVSFLICAYLTAGMMSVLVLFGFLMFIYLQTKPKNAARLFAVENYS
ncbi:unnamed protein product [Auanema sp. JU1783]|nr:unnamed protein product [Auanema sp. JU1783]